MYVLLAAWTVFIFSLGVFLGYMAGRDGSQVSRQYTRHLRRRLGDLRHKNYILRRKLNS